MPPLIPMRLLRIREAFDHPDFFFEPKLDGFRALAIVSGHQCELVSRNGHTFKGGPQLAEETAHAVRAHHDVLDGDICCLETDGRTPFNKLLFRRDLPYFYAFDVLSIEGEDLTHLPLLKRKRRLLAIMPAVECRLLYLDHVAGRGRYLFRLACTPARSCGCTPSSHRFFDYGNTAIEKRPIFFRRLVPPLDFGRERQGIDPSKVLLTHHALKPRK